MQQPEKLMGCIDIIRQVYDKWKIKTINRDIEKDEMMRGLRKKHGKH